MNLRLLRHLSAGLAVSLSSLTASAGDAPPPKFDIVPTEQRNPAVALGSKLSKQAESPRLPAEIKSPFHPPDFDRPGEGEGARTTGGAAAGPAPVTGARAVLQTAEPFLKSSVTGTFVLAGEPLLQLRGGNGAIQRLKVGQSFFITIEGVQYAIQLVSIDGKNYTLRYQDQQLTLSTAMSSSTPSPASPQTGKSQ